MTRKRWTPAKEITPAVLKLREKRKWQIALRRYVLEKNPCLEYAPYFALDIDHIRKWFEFQFTDGANWENFGEIWQFDHIIPVSFFDFSVEDDLRLCWNFVNLRADILSHTHEHGRNLDILAAREYFQDLANNTRNPICERMLRKIDAIKASELLDTSRQKSFLNEFRDHLENIRQFGSLEFELLNSGRSLDEVKKEIDFIKNLKR